MTHDDPDTRERLLQAATELLEEIQNPDKITARRIVERAGVGLGSINYHFESKDDLLYQAVMRQVGSVAEGWKILSLHPQASPLERLRHLLVETSAMMFHYPKYTQIALSYAIMHGDFEVQEIVLPLLREHFGTQKSEAELRLLAFELVVSLQIAGLRPEAFRRYSGIDPSNDEQRRMAINLMVDNLLTS